MTALWTWLRGLLGLAEREQQRVDDQALAAADETLDGMAVREAAARAEEKKKLPPETVAEVKKIEG